MSIMKTLDSGVKLNCTIVSDTHIDIKHPVPAVPKYFLRSALKDAKKSETPVDAFIIIGDATSRSSKINWDMTEATFAKVSNPAKNILIALGNHDTWSDEGCETALSRYLEYTGRITGVKRDKTYFSQVINGYHLIFLGSEGDAGVGAVISDGQIKWFEDEMEKAAASGLPILVFNHQCLNQTHGLPRTFDKDEDPNAGPMEGGVGESSEKIKAILKKYKQVYFFTGHSHMGISGEARFKREGYASFENDGELTLINLPSLACGNHHGDYKELGMGMQLEIYDDKLVIRPRKYNSHAFIKKVNIKEGKPYYFADIKKEM